MNRTLVSQVSHEEVQLRPDKTNPMFLDIREDSRRGVLGAPFCVENDPYARVIKQKHS